MTPQIELLPDALATLFIEATETGVLTKADRYGLMAALLQGNINDEERRAIDRLLHWAHRGRLSIV